MSRQNRTARLWALRNDGATIFESNTNRTSRPTYLTIQLYLIDSFWIVWMVQTGYMLCRTSNTPTKMYTGRARAIARRELDPIVFCYRPIRIGVSSGPPNTTTQAGPMAAKPAGICLQIASMSWAGWKWKIKNCNEYVWADTTVFFSLLATMTMCNGDL